MLESPLPAGRARPSSARRKVAQPETLRQARTFETFKTAHVHAGLCHTCASQAAYGRQLGFSRVAGPCTDACRSAAGLVPELGRWCR